jgi:hypothetical protein
MRPFVAIATAPERFGRTEGIVAACTMPKQARRNPTPGREAPR